MFFHNRMIVGMLLSCFVVLSCGGGREDDGASLEGVAAALTGDPDFGAIATHVNGERLAVMTTGGAGGEIVGVRGAVWSSPDGDDTVVYLSSDGLPERAVIGDVVFLFDNYTSSTVDVAVVATDGNIQIARDVEIDTDALSVLGSEGLRRFGTRTWGLSRILRVAGAAVTVAGCVAAAGISHGLAFPLLAAPCSAALVRAVVFSTATDEQLEKVGDVSDAIGCGLGDPSACIDLVVSQVRRISDRAQEIQQERSSEIAEARGTLASEGDEGGTESEAESEGEGEGEVCGNRDGSCWPCILNYCDREVDICGANAECCTWLWCIGNFDVPGCDDGLTNDVSMRLSRDVRTCISSNCMFTGSGCRF